MGIAHRDDGVDHLFDWYFNGDVEVPTAMPRLVFRTSAASARHIREGFASCGCLVSGRRLFDHTDGWGGQHPPIAGNKNVAVAGPNIIQQCLTLGLMDEICISLVPVLIGDGEGWPRRHGAATTLCCWRQLGVHQCEVQRL
jgi:hypothetical protein